MSTRMAHLAMAGVLVGGLTLIASGGPADAGEGAFGDALYRHQTAGAIASYDLTRSDQNATEPRPMANARQVALAPVMTAADRGN